MFDCLNPVDKKSIIDAILPIKKKKNDIVIK
jgi:hypothetical protein